jgi:hypothetical protein
MSNEYKSYHDNHFVILLYLESEYTFYSVGLTHSKANDIWTGFLEMDMATEYFFDFILEIALSSVSYNSKGNEDGWRETLDFMGLKSTIDWIMVPWAVILEISWDARSR